MLSSGAVATWMIQVHVHVSTEQMIPLTQRLSSFFYSRLVLLLKQYVEFIECNKNGYIKHRKQV